MVSKPCPSCHPFGNLLTRRRSPLVKGADPNLRCLSDMLWQVIIAENTMSLAAGTPLGPYEIIALVGEGGMGQVYKARDTRLDRVVAIKVSQAKYSERFEREARSAATLNHPNICQIHDVGENYLVMEFVDGAPIAAPDTPR